MEIFGAGSGSLVGKVLVPEGEERETDGERERERDRRRDGGGGGGGGGNTRSAKKMEGVSRVAFGNEGEAWLLGGERLWRIGFAGVGGGGLFELL